MRFPSNRQLILALIGVGCFTLASCRREIGGLKPGEKMPVIEAQTWINGPPPKLEGKVVVIDAWSSGCRPCVDAMPKMHKLYKKYSSRGVIFLGLISEHLDPQIEAATKVLKAYDIEYPNAYGAGATYQKLRVRAIPQIWVVGRDGIIVWNRDAPGTLEAAIEKALGE